ncbi:MAG: PocR ligand-binding domain-containing protein [Eubacteriales bacterium]|nr:PocR ligand-binding domain-containing protein [Eubacteriales bacterium]
MVKILAVAIFTLVSEERLHDVLETLHSFIELPIQLISESGKLLQSFGESTRYCALLKNNIFTNGECLQMHLKAGQRSQALGETYIFTCHANLNHIAFPLQSHGELLGCIIIGPFLMDVPDSTLVSGVAESYGLSPAFSLELYDELRSLQVIAPARVNHLSRLIDHLLKPLLPTERALLLQSQQKLYQQSRINETIQMYKEQGISPTQSYLYQKETELMTKVKTGNVKQSKALLNDLLGYVLFSEGGKLESVRTRAIELTTLLSRVSMEGGAKADSIYQLNSQFLLMMNQNHTIESLCFLLQDVVESFMSAMFNNANQGNAYIREALFVMAERYAQPLTLTMVAAEVRLSPNYFSTLFQHVVGVTFREQLCRIRVEESKRLLVSTDFPLATIALSMGFADQSYFCKVFKRITGITPSQFRH